MNTETLLAAALDAQAEANKTCREARVDLCRARRALVRRRSELAKAIAQMRKVDPQHPVVAEVEEILRATFARAAELTAKTTGRTRARVVYPPPSIVEGSVVYFVQAIGGGPIKIGTTTNLVKRVATLQAGSPVGLAVLATIAGDARTEGALHKRLRKHRLHGEWFADCAEVRAAMGATR